MYSEEEYYHKADSLIRISTKEIQGLFRARWTYTSKTEWTENSAQEFVQGEGQEFYRGSNSTYKRHLEQGNLDEWDLNLLIDIFLTVKSLGPDHDNYREEVEEALKAIRSVRNKLAHNARKKLKAKSYEEIEDTIRQSFIILRIESEKVESLISQAGPSSSDAALKQATKLKKLANEQISQGKSQQAIKHYDEALLIPSLLPPDLCTLYEQRASCYLEMGKNESNETAKKGFYDHAELDLNKALNLNENSWKAHSILARIYKSRHDLDNAFHHYSKAFALSPGQENLKQEIDECIQINEAKKREDHMNPFSQPTSLEQLTKQYNKSSFNEKEFSSEEILEILESLDDKTYPGQAEVNIGRRFALGWNTEQNFENAHFYFKKAMEKGNSDAIYNLALCYLEGHGVKKDIPYAIKLIRKAANMPGRFYEQRTPRVRLGVQGAQYALGLKYFEGVGVPQDYKQAASWFEKALELGSISAANNLASLYEHGLGVKKDRKMAELLYRKAVEQENRIAMQNLCLLYSRSMEPKLAKMWLDRSIELGNVSLSLGKYSVLRDIEKNAKTRKLMEKDVINFESKFGLSKRGMLFQERLERMMVVANHTIASKGDEEEPDEVADILTYFLNADLWGRLNSMNKNGINTQDIDDTVNRAQAGSVTAQRILAVFRYNDSFHLRWGSGPPFSEQRAKNIIDFVYLISCTEHHLFRFNPGVREQYKTFLTSMLEAHCSQKGDLDKKIRLCFALKDEPEDAIGHQLAIQVLIEGLHRYPNEAVYYHMLASLYGLLDEHTEALEIAKQGLDRFPIHVDLLYSKAIHARLKIMNADGPVATKKDWTNVRRAYLDFLNTAPEDHQKVPEAYYCLAFCYQYVMNKSNHQEIWEKIFEFYEKGKKAEKLQMSFYLPYESPFKIGLTKIAMLKGLKSNQNLTSRNEPFEEFYLPDKLSEGLLNILTATSKNYLKDPKRIEVRIDHRIKVKALTRKRRNWAIIVYGQKTPFLQQKLPRMLTGLEEITLREMDPTKDKVHEKNILNLTLIEDPVTDLFPSIHLVGMDDNLDVRRISLYNVPHNNEMREKLAYGCKISIVNPYMRVFVDGESGIRVDEPTCIFYLEEKVKNMCRYCNQGNAFHSCSNCNTAKYCSRECQVADWKELKHKRICMS